MIEGLPGLLTHSGYWLLFAAIVLDCAGLPVAGEILLIALGALVRAGQADPLAAAATAAAAAAVGHSLGYAAGRVAGDRLLRGRSPVVPGTIPLLFSRFLIGARVLIAPLTGFARVPFSRFVALDAAGAVLWVSVFMLVGYAGGAWAAFAGAIVESHLPVIAGAGAAVIVAGAAATQRRRHAGGHAALPAWLAR